MMIRRNIASHATSTIPPSTHLCAGPRRKEEVGAGVAHRFRILLLTLATVLSGSRAVAQSPSEYGRIVLDRYSSRAGVNGVVFDHWLHRAWFTCGLCHVDIGFAMQARGTDIKASTNKEGYHCGACHDGKRSFKGEAIFAACEDGAPAGENKRCARCHSRGKQGVRKFDYETFTAKLPKNVYGVDWEEAEVQGLIKPIDSLDGISIKRARLNNQEDFSIKARASWASDVIFSHKKHSIWNGCEVCHPEIFPTTQKGAIKYTMIHISAGQYCGVCHGKVAFRINACHKCHTGMSGL